MKNSKVKEATKNLKIIRNIHSHNRPVNSLFFCSKYHKSLNNFSSSCQKNYFNTSISKFNHGLSTNKKNTTSTFKRQLFSNLQYKKISNHFSTWKLNNNLINNNNNNNLKKYIFNQQPIYSLKSLQLKSFQNSNFPFLTFQNAFISTTKETFFAKPRRQTKKKSKTKVHFSKIRRKIIQYCSKNQLRKEAVLREAMDDEGFLSLEILLKRFPKFQMRSDSDLDTIVKAIESQHPENELTRIILDKEKMRVKLAGSNIDVQAMRKYYDSHPSKIEQ